jgi:hypothetical protein
MRAHKLRLSNLFLRLRLLPKRGRSNRKRRRPQRARAGSILYKMSAPVLKPYTADPRLRWYVVSGIVGAFLTGCFLFGSSFALTAPYNLPPYFLTLAALFGLAVWALPDNKNPPARLLVPILLALFAALYLWPNYLAFSTAGLPWITIGRLTVLPYTLIVLACFGTSAEMRGRVMEVWASIPWFRNLFIAYVTIEFLSILLSTDHTQSLNLFGVELTSATFTFVTASYIFRVPGRAERFVGYLLICAFSLTLIGILERRMGQIPWAGHVPGFLQINDPNVQRFLGGTERNGMHRVQTTFSTSLGVAEFISILAPFLLHFAINQYPKIVRISAVLAIPFYFSLVSFSQARTGMVGLLITFFVYPLLLAFISWRRSTNLIASTMVYVSPVLIVVSALAIVFVDGIRIRIFGGGSTQSSTQARQQQWELGLPQIVTHPWGFGIGRGAETVGYSSVGEGGTISIDTSYLNQLMQFGPLGFIIWMGVLISAIAYAFRGAMLSINEDREFQLFIPMTISFLVYLTTRSAFSSLDNLTMIYLLWGMMTALMWRLKVRTGLAPVKA